MNEILFAILNLVATSSMVYFAWKLKKNVNRDPDYSFAMFFNRKETATAFKVLSLFSYIFGIATMLAFISLIFDISIWNYLSNLTLLPLLFAFTFFFFELAKITQKGKKKSEE